MPFSVDVYNLVLLSIAHLAHPQSTESWGSIRHGVTPYSCASWRALGGKDCARSCAGSTSSSGATAMSKMRGALTRRVRHGRVAVLPRAFTPTTAPYLARRLATAGLQLSEAIAMRLRITQRCTHGGASSPLRLCGEPLLHIAPSGPWFKSVRNASRFFVYFSV
jgi:hypothetical protein